MTPPGRRPSPPLRSCFRRENNVQIPNTSLGRSAELCARWTRLPSPYRSVERSGRVRAPACVLAVDRSESGFAAGLHSMTDPAQVVLRAGSLACQATPHLSGLPPGMEPVAEFRGLLGHPSGKVVGFADVVLEVVQFHAHVFVELDELPIACPHCPKRPDRLLRPVMRIVPIDASRRRVPLSFSSGTRLKPSTAG